jgi:hypothetical protein
MSESIAYLSLPISAAGAIADTAVSIKMGEVPQIVVAE